MGNRTPLPTRAVIGLGAEIEQLTATGAAEAVANDITPRTIRADGGEWLVLKRGARRNLNDRAISDIITGHPDGLSKVCGGADGESLTQGCAAPAVTAWFLEVTHGIAGVAERAGSGAPDH